MKTINELLYRLNPAQMGFIYESLLLNAENDSDIEAKALALEVKDAIDSSCGKDEYANVYQPAAKKSAEAAY